jgi:hypothetical protein
MIKKWEQFNESDDNQNKSKMDIVEEYCSKYNTNFYKNFIEIYATKKDFDIDVVSEILDADTSGGIPEDMTDDEILDEYWDAQSELSVLGKIEGYEDISDDIDAWTDFINDLGSTDW